MSIISPNIAIMPVTAQTNAAGHLVIGGCDTTELAKEFGTPLWIIDQETIKQAVTACKSGLSNYPQSQIVYAGKAFLCSAMCHLLKSLQIGLDVVSQGELYTATKAQFPANLLLLHGNNKSKEEIETALRYQSSPVSEQSATAQSGVPIVIDNYSELEVVISLAQKINCKAKLFLRVIPDVVPETHSHITTGHGESKFGIPLTEIPTFIKQIQSHRKEVELLGLHVHIGSQANQIEPYLQVVEILAKTLVDLKTKYNWQPKELDLGGGLGITYTEEDKPAALYAWTKTISDHVIKVFKEKNLNLPKLILEPGRSLIGTAGITLYQVGHTKNISGNKQYISVNGGMADNPRPITYQALYTAAVANRMNEPKPTKPITIVGKYCEQGDILIEEAYIAPQQNDLIAIFGTGAYNYSMSSNYNRTGRPACVLVQNGRAELIIERETNEDLLRQDRVPKSLLT